MIKGVKNCNNFQIFLKNIAWMFSKIKNVCFIQFSGTNNVYLYLYHIWYVNKLLRTI